MPVILISGAASGLGLTFLQHYAQDSSNTIIAIDRSPISIQDSENIIKRKVDLANEESITALFQDPNCLLKRPIDLIIHSAGIRGLVPSIERANPDNVAAAETLEAMDAATLMRTYQINTIGTFLLLKASLPGLKAAAAQRPADDPPKVIIMSSRMGSISYNSTGGGYAYRASKAALNAMVKSFAIDVPEVVFASVHPGRVETGLTLCREEGAIEAGESVGEMVRTVGRLGRGDSGRFVDRWGGEIGW